MPTRSEPTLTKGARATVIDRLVDAEPTITQEPVPLRIVNRQELLESIRREVGWLLNTRCPPGSQRTDNGGSILNYGVPDLASWSPQSIDDQHTIAQVFGRTIREFEPRLHNVLVRIEESPRRPRALQAVVEAELLIGEVMEPVSFPVMLQPTQLRQEGHEESQ